MKGGNQYVDMDAIYPFKQHAHFVLRTTGIFLRTPETGQLDIGRRFFQIKPED